MHVLCLCRTSNRKQGKKFVVVFVPQKAQHCIMRFSVSALVTLYSSTYMYNDWPEVFNFAGIWVYSWSESTISILHWRVSLGDDGFRSRRHFTWTQLGLYCESEYTKRKGTHLLTHSLSLTLPPPLLSLSLSPSLPPSLQDMFLDNDPTPLYHIARSICHLQALYGIIPKIYGKGKNAKVIVPQSLINGIYPINLSNTMNWWIY